MATEKETETLREDLKNKTTAELLEMAMGDTENPILQYVAQEIMTRQPFAAFGLMASQNEARISQLEQILKTHYHEGHRVYVPLDQG